MSRTKKMVCHDCGTIFNRKPHNGDKQVCWNCKSLRVTLVTANIDPPAGIPKAPSPAGLKMPAPTPGGGAITPAMLLKQRSQLKAVVRPPVVLPGAGVSAIARGVRLLAHQVRNPVLRCGGIELEVVWREARSHTNRYAYTTLSMVDVGRYLGFIARGLLNPDHSNSNQHYQNLSRDLPIRKGPREASVLRGIHYFEYGWKRPVPPGAVWYGYQNGSRTRYSDADVAGMMAFLRDKREGKIFCERLVIAETGEVFYTPDHYGTFFRYHPGTMDWYRYRSAGGAAGPLWDESFYEEPVGA